MSDEDMRVVHVKLPNGTPVRCSAALARKMGLSLDGATDETNEVQEEVVQTPEDDADGSKDETTGDDTQAVTEEAPATSERPKAADVRAWAKENNVDVNEQGKIPNSVYEAYSKAH